MTETRFTPGRWAFNPETGSIYLDDGDVLPELATVRLDNTSEEQGIADGFLMSAALDLFRAMDALEQAGLLETLLSMDDAAAEDGEDAIAAPHIAHARAALQKARGEQS